MSQRRYHLSISGRTLEGLTEDEVRARIAADPVGATQALVWTDGWPDWVPAAHALGQPSSGPAILLRVLGFVPDFLEATDSGDAFRRAGAMLLRVLAVLAGVGGLVWWVFAWREIFDASARGVVAGILPQVVVAVAVFVIVRVFWHRARQVAELANGPAMATRAFGRVLRAWGDAALFYWSMQGVAFLLLVIVGGQESPRLKWTFLGTVHGGDYGEIVLGAVAQFGASVGVAVLGWFAAHLVADVLTAIVPAVESGSKPSQGAASPAGVAVLVVAAIVAVAIVVVS